MTEEGMDPEEFGGLGARVLREAIRTPAFLEIIKTHISGLDPDAARAAVRTLIREDPGLSLGLMGASPVALNYFVEAVLELGRQLADFPPPLIDAFVSQMIIEVDHEALKEVPRVYGPLLERAMESPEGQEAFAAALGRLVTTSARFLNKSLSENPRFLADVLANVDYREVLRAVVSICRSVLSSLISCVSRLIRR